MDLYELLKWIVLLMVIIYATYIYYTWPYSCFKNSGIPGPKPWPMLGTLLMKPIWDQDKEMIEKYGKVVGGFEGWLPTLYITDTEMIKQVFVKDFVGFCDRRYMPMQGIIEHAVTLVQGYEAWGRQRKHMSSYFSSGTMKKNMVFLNKVAANLMVFLDKKCENNEMVDCKSVISLFTLDTISCTGYGIETDSINKEQIQLVTKMREAVRRSSQANIPLMIAVFWPTLAKLLHFCGKKIVDFSYLQDFIHKLILQRKNSEQKSDDFLNTLLATSESQDSMKGMTNDEMIANAMIFLIGGYDNTANSLTFLIHSLVLDQECQQKVYEEIKQNIGDKIPSYEDLQKLQYLDMCMEENLRLFPLAARTERVCMRDTVVKDIPIKKGTLISLPIWYLHRNADIYPDPEKFDPDRFLPENKKTRDPIHYVPFGVGPRHCIAIRLVQLNTKLVMVRILQKFKLMKNDKTPDPVAWKPEAFLLTPVDGVSFSLERRPGDIGK